MKHIRILAAVVVSATLLPVCSQAVVYLNETFEDDTIGVAPGDLAQRQATQILTAAGTGLIGLDNVARHNDTSTTASGALEYNVGGSALSTMYIQFDLLNNAPVTTGSANNNLTFGVGAWNNTAASTFLGGTANRSFGVDFFQSGASSTLRLRSNSTAVVSTTYNMLALQTVKIWVNDDDANTLSYTRPDTLASATLGANSVVVWINDLLVTGELDSGYLMNSTLTVGNATLGRVGFNSTSATLTDFLIDNVYVADLAPVVPEPTSATLLLGGGMWLAWRSRRLMGR